MGKFFLLLALVLLLPLEARAAEIPSDVTGGIEVHEDAGIMPFASGYDGFHTVTEITSTFPSLFHTAVSLPTLYFAISNNAISFEVKEGLSSTLIQNLKTFQSGDINVSFDVPIMSNAVYLNYGSRYSSLQAGLSINSDIFVTSPNSIYFSYEYSIPYYTVVWTSSGGVYEFKTGDPASVILPGDYGTLQIFAHVNVSAAMNRQYTSGLSNTVMTELTSSFRTTSSISVNYAYGLVDIPPGEYSNVVNLNTIASQQAVWLPYLDYLDDIYGRATNLEIISANFRDNTYTQLNSIAVTAGTIRDNNAVQLNALYNRITEFDLNNSVRMSELMNYVLALDTHEGERFQALYGQLSVINHEIQVHMTNENTRLINALLQQTEYPDGDAGAGKLEDAFGEYDKAESQVTDTAFQWAGGFDPGSLLDFSVQIIVGIGQFNQILTALLAAMGSYQYVIYIGLGLVFVGILVGVYRFRG